MNRRKRLSIDKKIDSVRRKGRQLSVLSDINCSQGERKQALQELREDRQRPAQAYIADNLYSLPVQVDPNRPTLEQDMVKRVTNKYGYEVDPAGYQAFTNSQVSISPRVLPKANISNWDYQDPIHNPNSNVRYPSAQLKQQMTQANVQYTESVIHALKTKADRQRVKVGTIFERFERTNEVPQDQLYCIAAGLGIITEKYESTAGSWVVISPYYQPQSLEQVLYNQKGISNKTQSQLHKQQVGTYWRGADAAYNDVYNPQVRPAKPVPGPEDTEYYAGNPSNTKSAQSLRNPKRGDDFIRNSRVVNAVKEGKEEPCWDGYKRKPGTKRYAKGSCIPEAEQKNSCKSGYEYDPESGKCVNKKASFAGRGAGYGILHGHDDDKDNEGEGSEGGMGEAYNLSAPKKTNSPKKPFTARVSGMQNNKPSRRWDADKSVDQRRQQRQKQIDELYQLAERTVNPGVKGRYLRKIKALQNQQVSEDAAVRNKARREDEYRRGKDRVSAMAQSVSSMNNPDYQAEQAKRQQMAYNRHLSLLDEATKMLSNGHTGNLLY